MLTVSVFEQVYSAMIAGVLPNHSGDTDASVFMVARQHLGVDKVSMLTSESSDGQHVFYLAAPSSGFSSTEALSTSLAAAFPDHPDHQGNAIYVLSHTTHAVAILKRDLEFRLLFNSSDEISAWCDDQDLPVVKVESFTPWPVESSEGRLRYMADVVSRRALKIGLSTIFISLAISIAAITADGYFVATSERSENQATQAINSLVGRIDFSQPLSRQIAVMQKTSAVVVRAGGWIDEYEMVGDKEGFVISLPEWVTQDYIEALGPGAVAERDRQTSSIRVVKKCVSCDKVK